MRKWVEKLKHKVLQFLYKKLILSVRVMDKPTLWNYEALSVYAGLDVPTNKGNVTFIFKADRRQPRGLSGDSSVSLCNYFVETQLPQEYQNENNKLYDKVIMVTMIRLKSPNVQAMAWLLLKQYVQEMHPQ